MYRFSIAKRVLLTLGAGLLMLAPAQAQPPQLGVRPQPYSTLGPVDYGVVTYYGARPAYTGYPVARPVNDIGFVSHYTSAYSPVFLTSINFPGVYGTHTMGVVARDYTSSQRFTFYPPAEGVALRDPIPLTPASPPVEPVTPTNVVSLRVHVPQDAELYFQGTRMTKTGPVRDFVSPPLLNNRDYTYDIRAIWRDKDGREIEKERQVKVKPGDKLDIDLLAPETNLEAQPSGPALRTMPRPERPQQ
jgi:uncharacterized protein (TIGR03000 family)